jgi:hypothetical protein
METKINAAAIPNLALPDMSSCNDHLYFNLWL